MEQNDTTPKTTPEVLETPQIPDISTMSDSEFENLDAQMMQKYTPEVENIDVNSTNDTQENESLIPNIDTPSEEIASETPLEGVKDVGLKYTSEEAASVYETIFGQPLKAAGKEIKITSVEELLRLAQQGVDYNRKMQHIRKDKALVATLTEAGLNDPAKLSLLIDVANGNQEAIKQLLKDQNIDSISTEDSDTSYTPNNKVPSDGYMHYKEIAENISQEIGGIEFLQGVLELDQPTQQTVQANPQLLVELYKNKQSGAYDIIVNELERRKLLGDPAVIGRPFHEAYTLVGNDLVRQQESPKTIASLTPKTTPPQNITMPTTASKQATITKGVKPLNGTANGNKLSVKDIDVSSMSDAEFDRFVAQLS